MPNADVDDRTPITDLLTIPETAKLLDIHAYTLSRWCRAGQFAPTVLIGSRYRISRRRLERYLHGETT